MPLNNPAGTDGFDFLEFTTNEPKKLAQQFEIMGFHPIATHQKLPITLYQQNDICFILNATKDSMASEFARLHGASACAMGFRVHDAEAAFQHAIANGAQPFRAEQPNEGYDIPAIHGVGGSLIYFVDYKNNLPNYAHLFSFAHMPKVPRYNAGLTYIDHVTHNLHRGEMVKWADFYTKIFNFREIRYFDIEGRVTGLTSKAMTSPCNKIRIPLNQSSDDQSQIEEFLKEFNGEGIQHIALGTNGIYDSVDTLRQRGIEFLDTPDTYFEMIDKRLPDHGESILDLKKHRILIDGDTQTPKGKKLLLQIFTKNMLGPVFFEVIQRKGDEGFGEGNFRALFESIELDQIRRGVITLEKEDANTETV